MRGEDWPAVAALLFLGEHLNWVKALSLTMIVAGVVGLNLAVMAHDRGDLRLVVLYPLLLRAYQQEPENDEDQDQRNGLNEEACAGR